MAVVALLTWWIFGIETAAAAGPPDCGSPEGWPDTQRLLWPTESRVPSRRFNDKHRGLDIGARLGDPVWASANGTIERVDFDPTGYGRYLIYAVADAWPGMSVLYGHLEQILVSEGMSVQPGVVLCLAGNSGDSTKPHLHYEVRCAKQGHIWYMDPLYYLEKVWWPEWQGVETTFALIAPATPALVAGPTATPTPAGPLPFGSVIVVFPAMP